VSQLKCMYAYKESALSIRVAVACLVWCMCGRGACQIVIGMATSGTLTRRLSTDVKDCSCNDASHIFVSPVSPFFNS
jgi:hypothetical protein